MSQNLRAYRPPTVSSVLLIDIGGAAYEVLAPLAASGTMPNVARLLQSAALARLRDEGPIHGSVASATLHSGAGPAVHGTLDDYYLDHRLGCLMPGGLQPLSCCTLQHVVTATCPQEQTVYCVDGTRGSRIWPMRPSSFSELCQGVAQSQRALHETTNTARQIDRSGPWRLLCVRFRLLDVLLHRLRHMLGIADIPGGNRHFVAKTREVFRTLDRCLGELLELADRRGAATAIVSPYGIGPFHDKITISELLCRRDLLRFAGTPGVLHSRMTRLVWKARRKLLGNPPGHPIRALLASDMRHTRALSFHGHSAALVYLNTPERFGTDVLASPRQRDQASADLLAAFREARHPVTQQPLFDDVYFTANRFDCDPIARSMPDLVAIPVPGFYTRHRLDANRRLTRPDRSLSGARTDEGLLLLHVPHLDVKRPCTARLIDVAPTLLAIMGLEPAASMTGQAISQWFPLTESPVKSLHHRLRAA